MHIDKQTPRDHACSDDALARGLVSPNGKSLGRNRSYSGALVLCLGLVHACRELISQRDIELIYYYPLMPHIMG